MPKTRLLSEEVSLAVEDAADEEVLLREGSLLRVSLAVSLGDYLDRTVRRHSRRLRAPKSLYGMTSR